MIEVELPDGRVVEFPDGTQPKAMEMALAKFRERGKSNFSNVQTGSSTVAGGDALDAINAKNRAYMASPQLAIDKQRQDAWQAQEKKRQFGELPAPVRALIGVGGRVGSAVRGIGQVGAGVMDYVAPKEQTMSGLVSGNDPSRYGKAMVAEAAARENDKFMEGDTAASVGGIGADIAMMALPLSKVGALPRAGQYAASALTGAGFGAFQPVVEGESRGRNAIVGGALGLGGQGLSDGVMAVGKRAAAAVTPELRKLASYGESIGLPLTGADVAKSDWVKRFASLSDALPLSAAAGRQQARSAAVGKQVARTIGQDSDQLNQGVMAQAYDDLGKQYDDFFKDGMDVDNAFLENLGSIQKFTAENLDDTASKATANFVNRVTKQIQEGRISGSTLQSLDEQARRLATGGGDRHQVMSELRDELHAAFGRQGGMSDAWRDLNRKYANYKTIEPLVARNPQGIAPEQLLQAVNATKIGKARMARGQAGDIGDLALLGHHMKPPRTSKTPEGLLNLALGAGSALAPTVAIPLGLLGNLGGRLLNSKAAGQFLLREGRGQGAQRLSPYLRPAGMPAGGLLSQQWDEWSDDPRKRP